MTIAFVLLFIIVLLLSLEKYFVYRSVSKIRLRILVNGTRGKSTVTKYVSELLRSNNISTFSKITGVIPTLYYKDGNEKEINRRGPARVTEQFKIIRSACKNHADALVLENMTINPELLKIESSAFKPHYYIITNIHEDHLEETGLSPVERVKVICDAIPPNSTVITAEKSFRNEIKSAALKKGCKFIHIDEYFDEELELTSSSVIYDNAAISYCVAKELNLETDTFLQTINKSSTLRGQEIDLKNIKVKFINGFAINDVSSAKILMNDIGETSASDNNRIIIFNSRADRPLRSKQFVEWFSQMEDISKFIIAGDHTGYSNREMIKKGLAKNKIIIWNKNDSKNAKERLSEFVSESVSVIGLGNIKNDGFNIINSLSV